MVRTEDEQRHTVLPGSSNTTPSWCSRGDEERHTVYRDGAPFITPSTSLRPIAAATVTQQPASSNHFLSSSDPKAISKLCQNEMKNLKERHKEVWMLMLSEGTRAPWSSSSLYRILVRKDWARNTEWTHDLCIHKHGSSLLSCQFCFPAFLPMPPTARNSGICILPKAQ